MKRFIPKLKFLALFLGIIVFANAAYAMFGGISNAIGSISGSALTGAGFGGSIIGIVISLFGFGATGFCWFCDLYKTLFDIMNAIATSVSTNLKNDFLMLLGVGMLFFIAFKVGATVVKLQEVDLMQFLGELFKHLGRAIIAAAFLFGTVQMYHYLISPFLAYSLGLTHEIMTHRNAGTMIELTTRLLGGGKDGSGFIPAINSGILNEGALTAFSTQIRDQLIGLLELISASLIGGMIIGAVVILIAFADAYLNIIPNFQILIVGFAILGAYFSVYLAVPFKLIDVMVRLTFVAALTPLWIILWVFPATASYTKNAWEMLLNCCACIICLGVVLVIALEVLESMMPGKESIILFLLGGLDMLATGQMNLINPAVLQTIALGMLATSLVKNSSNIATQIVKSYGTSIGEGLDKAVGQGVSSMGKLGAALGGASLALTSGSVKDLMSMGKSAHKSVQDSSLPTWLGGNWQEDRRKKTQDDAHTKMDQLEKQGTLTSAQQSEYKEQRKIRNENAKLRQDHLASEIQDLEKKKKDNNGQLSNEDSEKLNNYKKEYAACEFLGNRPEASANDFNVVTDYINKNPTASAQQIVDYYDNWKKSGGPAPTPAPSPTPAPTPSPKP